MKSTIDVNKIILEDIQIVNANLSNNKSDFNSEEFIGFDISFDFNHGVNLERKKVKFIVEFEINALNENEEKIDLKCEFDLNFIYDFEDLNEFTTVEEDNVIMDGNLAATLLGISYSTARGIIYTRCLGTLFDGVSLPIISPMDFINNADNSIKNK